MHVVVRHSKQFQYFSIEIYNLKQDLVFQIYSRKAKSIDEHNFRGSVCNYQYLLKGR